ncbi:IS630 family transposase [Streptomyces sp. NPDC059037]|uniref:IS630 family transposase n=1 Tax=Streptomyces sp. NPDC059037 TaxID=3346710 RepID=UPI0036CAA431
MGEHQALSEAEQQAVRQAVLDHRPCEAAVRAWREETWPAIRAKAKSEGAEVLFADQVGIRSDQVTGRTWGETGRTPIVRRSGNRFSVNAMPAISTKGRMHFMAFTETFAAEVMCRFRDRLSGHFDRTVHLVLDGHSAHRSCRVRDWLAEHPDRIELHFLPGYSPELNPDELVNANHTSSAATSAAPTSVASSNGTNLSFGSISRHLIIFPADDQKAHQHRGKVEC